jgi:hypothetical protein
LGPWALLRDSWTSIRSGSPLAGLVSPGWRWADSAGTAVAGLEARVQPFILDIRVMADPSATRTPGRLAPGMRGTPAIRGRMARRSGAHCGARVERRGAGAARAGGG